MSSDVKVLRCSGCGQPPKTEAHAGEACTRWPCSAMLASPVLIEKPTHTHSWQRTYSGDMECSTCQAWRVGGIS